MMCHEGAVRGCIMSVCHEGVLRGYIRPTWATTNTPTEERPVEVLSSKI